MSTWPMFLTGKSIVLFCFGGRKKTSIYNEECVCVCATYYIHTELQTGASGLQGSPQLRQG